MATVPEQVRLLRIKGGVVARLIKEYAMYEREAVDQKERIAKLKGEGADDATIRKQYEVLEETNQMIPDTKQRLVTAFEDLDMLLEGEILEQAKENAVYQKAVTARMDAKPLVES